MGSAPARVELASDSPRQAEEASRASEADVILATEVECAGRRKCLGCRARWGWRRMPGGPPSASPPPGGREGVRRATAAQPGPASAARAPGRRPVPWPPPLPASARPAFAGVDFLSFFKANSQTVPVGGKVKLQFLSKAQSSLRGELGSAEPVSSGPGRPAHRVAALSLGSPGMEESPDGPAGRRLGEGLGEGCGGAPCSPVGGSASES